MRSSRFSAKLDVLHFRRSQVAIIAYRAMAGKLTLTFHALIHRRNVLWYCPVNHTSRKERNGTSEHGSCNSGRGLSATAGAGNGANATPSAAVSATPAISPLPMQALGENNRGAANSDIPLAKHWLPADTFSSPLDGPPQLRHQLEKLARVFTKYERALILYEARSGT